MSDALDRLKKRARPKVPPRDASLSSASPDIQTSRHQESETSIKTQSSLNDQAIPASIPEGDVAQSPASPAEELQVKRSTFRMEEGLTERLHSLCRNNKISREVLMEAMFEYMEDHPEALQEVMEVARQKNEYRQQIANRKRAAAMMQKFGSG